MTITKSTDKELVTSIETILKENGGYCPCSLIQDENTKCPCTEFRVQKTGECHCGLYVKTE